MNNTNESGRSMVEMLGVLAIIGVLSVMGIAGYTQAMKKYKTNEAVAAINMAAVLCKTGDTSVTGLSRPNIVDITKCYPLDDATKPGSVDFTLKDGVVNASVHEALQKLGNPGASIGDDGKGSFLLS